MKNKNISKLGSVIIHIIMFALALVWLYPYAWMFMASIKPTANVMTTYLWQGPFTFENFGFLVDSAEKLHFPFLRAIGNSIFVTFVSVVCVIISTALISYALTKLDFFGKKMMDKLIIFQMVMPTFMFLVPQFLLMRYLNILNTYSALFLPYVVSVSAIFMVSQSFKGTPDAYIEAARIDGASDLWIIFRLMMPLNRAIISIVAINAFTGVWNDFLWPLIVISDYNKMTLAMLLATFAKNYSVYLGPIMAGTVILTIPMVIGFIVFRKFILGAMNLSLK